MFGSFEAMAFWVEQLEVSSKMTSCRTRCAHSLFRLPPLEDPHTWSYNVDPQDSFILQLQNCSIYDGQHISRGAALH